MARPKLLELHYSPDQIAVALGVHVKTVRLWIRRGKFGDPTELARNAIRIPASAVNKFLEERKTPAGAVD